MALTVKTLTGTLSATLNGTTSFTSSGLGAPDAAYVIVTDADTTNNPDPDCIVSHGIWDGTNQWCISFSARSGVAPSAGVGRFRNENRIAAIKVKTSSTPTYSTYAEYTIAAITDGVEIELVEDATTVERYATVVLFWGLSDAKLVTNWMSATSATSWDINDVGFQPDLLFALNVGVSSTGEIESNIISGSVGVAYYNGTTVKQGCLSLNSVSGSSSVVNTSITNDSIAMQYYNDGATINRTFTVGSFDSSGFTLTVSSSAAQPIIFLALKLPAATDAELLFKDTATDGTGTEAYTGAGFEPQAALLFGANETTYGSTSSSPNVGQFIGATDGTNTQSLAWGTVDLSSSGTGFSRRSTDAVLIRDSDDDEVVTATFGGFDSDGFTLNYSAFNATARKVAVLAFKAPAAGYTHPTLSAATLVPAGGNTYQPRVTYTF
jgi:hypothetical protein